MHRGVLSRHFMKDLSLQTERVEVRLLHVKLVMTSALISTFAVVAVSL
jgi:hypothetical protein